MPIPVRAHLIAAPLTDEEAAALRKWHMSKPGNTMAVPNLHVSSEIFIKQDFTEISFRFAFLVNSNERLRVF